jgi:ATP-dependent Lhr-like helicase
LATRAGLANKNLVSLGGQSYVIFPWLGTVSFRTLRRLLKTYAAELGISDIESQGCYYITFKAKDGTAEHLELAIRDILENLGEDTERLVGASECPVFDKYDEFIPPELLRRAYAADRLQLGELQARYLGGEGKEQ